MKRTSAKLFKGFLVSLVGLLLIGIMPISVGAEEPNSKTSKTQVSDFITYVATNNEYQYSINQQDLFELKKKLDSASNGRAKDELYIDIFRALGYSDERITNQELSEIKNAFENALEITVTVKYIRTDVDGSQTVISRESALSEAEEINIAIALERQEILSKLQSNETSFDEENNNPSRSGNWNQNGYQYAQWAGIMEAELWAIYLLPSSLPSPITNQRGWYDFEAKYRWLTTPSNATGRMTDGISLAAKDYTWSQSDADYEATFKYSSVIDYPSSLNEFVLVLMPNYYSVTIVVMKHYTCNCYIPLSTVMLIVRNS